MRKLVLTLAALGAVGMVVPFAAPAIADSTVIIRKHNDNDHVLPPPPPFHRDHDKTTIIKKHDND